MSDEKEKCSSFGLAHIKKEGAPIHPDDTLADFTDEQYDRQLKAYNDYFYDDGRRCYLGMRAFTG
jgi:hypothetical protein